MIGHPDDAGPVVLDREALVRHEAALVTLALFRNKNKINKYANPPNDWFLILSRGVNTWSPAPDTMSPA